MSRTDLEPATIARSLRRMAGNGSIEWVMEPMQASVLLDMADALDENAKLRERVAELEELTDGKRYIPQEWYAQLMAENAKLRQQLADVTESMGRVEERCAKLRELVCKVEHFESAGCFECPHSCGGFLYDDSCLMRREIEQDKRALGIEVVDAS